MAHSVVPELSLKTLETILILSAEQIAGSRTPARAAAKCPATTNIVESPHRGVEQRTHKVTRWRSQDRVERWAASAWLLTERHFRKVSGHRDLWSLAGILGRETNSQKTVSKETERA